MNDDLLWQAIEGALGTAKTAYLRTTPLSEITGAQDMSTAVAAHASATREKKAFWKSARRGFHSLEKVASPSSTSAQPYPPNTSFTRKIAVAQKARLLEGALQNQENVKVASFRREVDKDIFSNLIKKANALTGAIKSPAARELAESVVEGGKGLAGKALGGAAVAGGAAVPLYIGGSALSDKATEDARNRALQTAAGVGGMAMLGYGANRLMDNAAYHNRHKEGSAKAPVMEKISALTATVYIDQFLDQVDQTEKVAALREVNRDYGVTLLCELEKSALLPTVPNPDEPPSVVTPENLELWENLIADAPPEEAAKMRQLIQEYRETGRDASAKTANALKSVGQEAWNIAKSPFGLAKNLMTEGGGQITRRVMPDDLKGTPLPKVLDEIAPSPGGRAQLETMYRDIGLDPATATLGESLEAGLHANRREMGANALRAGGLGAGIYGYNQLRDS